MDRKIGVLILKRINVCILLCFVTTRTFALESQAKLWSGIDISGALFKKDSHWVYDLNTQGRYNFTEHRYQSTRSEAGLGYKISSNLSLWFGYTWTIQNIKDTQQHQVWQQVLWNINSNEKDPIHVTSRTRLETRKDNHEPQWSVRFRQRLQLSFPKISKTCTPTVYDELFLNFNNPSWVNHQMVNQNRVFIGLDIQLKKKVNVQIGYLNQFQIRNSENRLNHILYANLNIKT